MDLDGRETTDVIPGLGTMYTWNVVSPRLGMTARLTADGRTILRASYGQFSQGVLTGELGLFHPAVSPITTRSYDSESGEYKNVISVVDPKINLQFDPPHAPAAHERIFCGRGSRSGAPDGRGDCVCGQERCELHRVDRRDRPIPFGTANRRRTRHHGVRWTAPHGRVAASASRTRTLIR